MSTSHNEFKDGEGIPERIYLAGCELAKSYGHASKINLADRGSSFLTQRHIVICDQSGNELIRLPRRLAEDSSSAMASHGDRAKAVAWAQSMGYPVPKKPDGCLSAILIFIGLLIFIVPGVMIIIWIAYAGQVYEREMNALVSRWVDAGKPEPGVATNVDSKIASVENLSVQGQLLEYKSMLDGGLISGDEYEALRKKALGL